MPVSVSLNSIDVCAEDAPSAGEIHQLFSALSSRLFLPALTSVVLRHVDSDVELGSPLEFSDFERLLQFNNLEFLRLEIASSPERISDSLLEAMSYAWPQLTSLEFQYCLFKDVLPSQCTFHGILQLAMQCPRLDLLTIIFMAFGNVNWNSGPGGGLVHQNLKYLDVGNSLIDDSETVASLLSDIFPNIQYIEVWDVVSGYDVDWDEKVLQRRNRDRWREAYKLYKKKRRGDAATMA
jgi:hypothetical protein